jgi:hypothetical protein
MACMAMRKLGGEVDLFITMVELVIGWRLVRL